MEAYLDNSATTMAYPEVGELVYKVMCRDYGNPSSMHRKGVDAEHYVKGAKESLAKLMKVNVKEIFGKAYESKCKRYLFYFRWNGER